MSKKNYGWRGVIGASYTVSNGRPTKARATSALVDGWIASQWRLKRRIEPPWAAAEGDAGARHKGVVTALYREILLALQVEPAFGFMRLLSQLRSTLHDLARKGRYVLFIVDEAHLLSPELLDQLRFLLNDDMDSASLLTLTERPSST